MRERMTFKKLLCKIFGHRFEYIYTYNRKKHYWCNRCGTYQED